MRAILKKTIDDIVYHMPKRLRLCAERFHPPVAFINYYKEIMEDDFLDLGDRKSVV